LRALSQSGRHVRRRRLAEVVHKRSRVSRRRYTCKRMLPMRCLWVPESQPQPHSCASRSRHARVPLALMCCATATHHCAFPHAGSPFQSTPISVGGLP